MILGLTSIIIKRGFRRMIMFGTERNINAKKSSRRFTNRQLKPSSG